VPTPLAFLNSLYGGDGGYIRGYLSNSNDKIWFHLQEDQVDNEERDHATEIVSWMAFLTQECYYIQNVCQDFCPSGFSLSSKQCLKDSGFVFHLTPHEVKDTVYDNINSIPVSTGEDSSFYPNYKPSDPWAAYMRGYYFTGSSYMSFSGLTLAPHFTLTVWVRPDSGSDTQVLFSKEDGGELVEFALDSGKPRLKVLLKNLESLEHTSSSSITPKTWNFLWVKVYVKEPEHYFTTELGTNLDGGVELESTKSPGTTTPSQATK